MKRLFIVLLGTLFVSSLFLSSCSSQKQCAAYSTYPKKKSRTR